MIEMEAGRPEVTKGDLIVFCDRDDQPSSFLVCDICRDQGDRPVLRGLWNSDLGQMDAVIKGYAEILSSDLLKQHFLTRSTGRWIREDNILWVW